MIKAKLPLLVFILCTLTTLTQAAPRATINWVSTFSADGESGLEISITERIRYEEIINRSPPKITLRFPRTAYAQGEYTASTSIPPMHRLAVRPDPQDEDDLLIEIYMDRLPQFTTQWLGDDLLLVTWPEERKYSRERPRERRSLGGTVSMNFRGAELVDILRLLAFQNDLNIITGDDVEGEVTVSLRDVNLFEALDAILKVNGYDWFEQENIIVVKPKDEEVDGELETRVYKLEYADASAISTAMTNVLTSKGMVQVFSPVMKGGAGGSGGASGGGATGGGAAGGMGGAMGGATGGMGGASGGMGGSGGQNVTFDHLVVTDVRTNFSAIEKLINELDKRIPQINIAVKFIETKLTNEERLGINWDMRTTMTAPNVSADEASVTDDLLELGKIALSGGSLNFATLTMPVFQAMFEALSNDDDTRLMQEPNVTTRENTMATVDVGTTYPVVTETSTGLAGGTESQYEEVEIKVTLNVMPRISEGRYISMNLNAQVQALVGFGGPDGTIPIVSERSTSNQVMVENGETLLIGGLIFDNITETVSTPPVFGAVPIVKRFFTHRRTTTEQRELLIFITPNIIETN